MKSLFTLTLGCLLSISITAQKINFKQFDKSAYFADHPYEYFQMTDDVYGVQIQKKPTSAANLDGGGNVFKLFKNNSLLKTVEPKKEWNAEYLSSFQVGSDVWMICQSLKDASFFFRKVTPSGSVGDIKKLKFTGKVVHINFAGMNTVNINWKFSKDEKSIVFNKTHSTNQGKGRKIEYAVFDDKANELYAAEFDFTASEGKYPYYLVQLLDSQELLIELGDQDAQTKVVSNTKYFKGKENLEEKNGFNLDTEGELSSYFRVQGLKYECAVGMMKQQGKYYWYSTNSEGDKNEIAYDKAFANVDYRTEQPIALEPPQSKNPGIKLNPYFPIKEIALSNGDKALVFEKQDGWIMPRGGLDLDYTGNIVVMVLSPEGVMKNVYKFAIQQRSDGAQSILGALIWYDGDQIHFLYNGNEENFDSAGKFKGIDERDIKKTKNNVIVHGEMNMESGKVERKIIDQTEWGKTFLITSKSYVDEDRKQLVIFGYKGSKTYIGETKFL